MKSSNGGHNKQPEKQTIIETIMWLHFLSRTRVRVLPTELLRIYERAGKSKMSMDYPAPGGPCNTPPPSHLNGGIFGTSGPYMAVRWPTLFVSIAGEPEVHVARRTGLKSLPVMCLNEMARCMFYVRKCFARHPGRLEQSFVDTHLHQQ